MPATGERNVEGMAYGQGLAYEEQRTHRPAEDADRRPAHAASEGHSSYPASLLGDTRLKGRGNGSVGIALMQDVQRAYGNRSMQRFLQRTLAAPVAVQRCGGEVHAGCSCAGGGLQEDEQTKGITAQRTPDDSDSWPSVQRQEGEGETHPTLVQGMSGPSVAEAQSKLNAAGASPPLDVDGQFGPKTRSAVFAFQEANGLQVDGMVGQETWGALDGAGQPGCQECENQGGETGDGSEEAEALAAFNSPGDFLNGPGSNLGESFENAQPATVQTRRAQVGSGVRHVPVQRQTAKSCPICAKPGKKKLNQVPTSCEGGACHPLKADQQGNVTQDDSVLLNPGGKAEHDIFQKLLNKPDPAAGDLVTHVLISELAEALIRPAVLPTVMFSKVISSRTFASLFVERGNLQSIVDSLNLIKAAVNDVGSQNPSPFIAKTSTRAGEQELIIARIDALITTYQSQLVANQDPNAQSDPKSTARQSLVSIAASQIGLVQDRLEEVDPDDPTEGKVRVGYKHLKEYFQTAFGDPSRAPNEDAIKHRRSGEVWTGEVKKDDQGNETKVMKHTDDILPEWCGVFVLWAFKSAGLNVGAWPASGAFSEISGFRPVTGKTAPDANGKTRLDVKPGDVGTLKTNSHMYIVLKVNDDGDTITSIDANTDGAGGTAGGEIAMHANKRRVNDPDSTGFFRAEDLV